MIRVTLVIICIGISNLLFAQADSVQSPPKQDTVVMADSSIVPLQISCYVVNGFGGGDQELLVLNSATDVQYAFGYNCTFPNIDFSNKTVLYFSIKTCENKVSYKIKTLGNHVIFYVSINTNCFNVNRQKISVVIPKIGVDSSVSLDVTDLGKH